MASSARAPKAKDKGAASVVSANGKALHLDLLYAEKKVKQLEVEAGRCSEVEAENQRLARRLQMARQSREQRENGLREQIAKRRSMLASLQEESTTLALEEASSEQRTPNMATEPAQPLGKVLAQELRNSHSSVTRATLGRGNAGRKSHPETHERRSFATIEKDGHLLLTAVELEAIDVCYNAGSLEMGRLGAVALHPAPAVRELEDISHYLVHMWEDMVDKTSHIEAFHAERAIRLERQVSRVREQIGKLGLALEHTLMDLAIEEFVKQELIEKNLDFVKTVQELTGEISAQARPPSPPQRRRGSRADSGERRRGSRPDSGMPANEDSSSPGKSRAGGPPRRSVAVCEETKAALDRASDLIHKATNLGARVRSEAPDVWPALFQYISCELKALRAEGGRMRTKLAAAQLAKEREIQPGPRLKQLERRLDSELFSVREKVARLLIDVEPLAEWTAAVEAMITEFQPGESEPLDVSWVPEVHQAIAQIQDQLEALASGENFRERSAPEAKESVTQSSTVSEVSSPTMESGVAKDTIAQISEASAQSNISVTSNGHEGMRAGDVGARSDESLIPRSRLDQAAPSSAGSEGSRGSRVQALHDTELRVREQVKCVVEEALSHAKHQGKEGREARIQTQVQAVMDDVMSKLSGSGGDRDISHEMPTFAGHPCCPMCRSAPLYTCGCHLECTSSSSLSEARHGAEQNCRDDSRMAGMSEVLDGSGMDEGRLAGTHCPYFGHHGSDMTEDLFTHSSEMSVPHNLDRIHSDLVDEFVEGFTDGAVAFVDADTVESNTHQNVGAPHAGNADHDGDVLPSATAWQNTSGERSQPPRLVGVHHRGGVEESAPDDDLVCMCGTAFKIDANFCQKCGASRQELPCMTSCTSVIHASIDSEGNPRLLSEDRCLCGQWFEIDASFCRTCGTSRSYAVEATLSQARPQRAASSSRPANVPTPAQSLPADFSNKRCPAVTYDSTSNSSADHQAPVQPLPADFSNKRCPAVMYYSSSSSSANLHTPVQPLSSNKEAALVDPALADQPEYLVAEEEVEEAKIEVADVEGLVAEEEVGEARIEAAGEECEEDSEEMQPALAAEPAWATEPELGAEVERPPRTLPVREPLALPATVENTTEPQILTLPAQQPASTDMKQLEDVQAQQPEKYPSRVASTDIKQLEDIEAQQPEEYPSRVLGASSVGLVQGTPPGYGRGDGIKQISQTAATSAEGLDAHPVSDEVKRNICMDVAKQARRELYTEAGLRHAVSKDVALEMTKFIIGRAKSEQAADLQAKVEATNVTREVEVETMSRDRQLLNEKIEALVKDVALLQEGAGDPMVETAIVLREDPGYREV